MTQSIWTDDLVGKLKSLRGQRMTFQQIAETLDLTRNQVGGRLWRLQRAEEHASGAVSVRRYRAGGHDDHRYFESWADRKARLARERARTPQLAPREADAAEVDRFQFNIRQSEAA